MSVTPLALLLAVALAVTGASSMARAEIIDEIQVTATRIPATVTDVPTGVTLIDADEIADEALLTDAFAMTRGVWLQQTTPGQGVAVIRGLKGSEVLHLVDGMRLNNAIFRNAPTQYLALVAPFWVDRLEVVRGSEASLYGSDAMGGVVQVLTRRPDLDDPAGPYRGRVALGADTGELARSVSAEVEAANDRVGMLAGVDYREFGDRRIGDGERVVPSGYESEAARLAFSARPTEDTEWFLDLQYLRQPRTPRVDELVPGFGQTEPSSAEFFFEPNTRRFVHLQGTKIDGPLASDWTLDIAWQQISDDRTSRAFASDTRIYEDNSSDLFGVALNGVREIGETSWTYGAEWYHDTVDSSRNALELTTGQRDVVEPRFPDGSTVEQRALYFHALRDFGERQRFSGGLRYSVARIELAATAASPATKLSPDDLSGDLGWLFRLDGRWNLVANIGRGFRAPNISDLGTLGPRPGNRFNIANPSLGPETVWQYDAGIKGAGDDWQFELLVYRLDYRDRITSVPTGATTADGREVVQNRNLAEAEITGFEAGARVALGGRLVLDTVINYSRGEESEPGSPTEPADRIPPLNGRIGLAYAASDRLSVEPYLEFAAEQDRLAGRDIRDVRIDPAGTPGWLTLNLHLDYRSVGSWRVSLAAENLFDKAYRTHGSGLDATGRNLRVNLRYEW